MTNQKTPETLEDAALDDAQGGGVVGLPHGSDSRDSYANLEVSHMREPSKPHRDGK